MPLVDKGGDQHLSNLLVGDDAILRCSALPMIALQQNQATSVAGWSYGGISAMKKGYQRSLF
ncbi:hypothetical protein DRB80_18905 [Salmonella enterica]|uniref:Uncharacterized protein n=4 Tax=Salmonella enterica TaxID=28901 RepID=A0A344SPH3_SALER|nr:hypothetical protein CHD54_11130 [Salmonella enterica]EAA3682022.1 hypothetical protein [Salmonella enterica subsp. houtenae]EAA7382221.1 hypothetical protein [Salmonella enterica subsp. enterica]EAU5131550.1 hypothetical protein [Salmonella enterica subsp. enterica serovar Oranienburg]EBH8100092.1 hypothetical protein [Salmonella enterica subsp. houtenae serovar O:11:g,z25:-]EBQ5980643.1 hypothetical protein [Salmonella enterica subsp. houtenae serovar Houten]EBX0545242.1 hypothetical pro